MGKRTYDAIIVGAGCAGSPTAMLLARKGYNVLLVDKASFPSDTLSTHMIHPPGVQKLKSWGLLDSITATGCPPIHARAVVGTDGIHSFVEASVGAEHYNDQAPLLAADYSYGSGIPDTGQFNIYARHSRGFGAWSTNDRLTLIVGGWPNAEFEANKKDVETHFVRMLDLAPPIAEKVRSGRREAKFARALVPNYFRKPYGNGWALVGDAGYIKDSITAQGIADVFRDAEACSNTLDDVFSGRSQFDDAMGRYHTARDAEVTPMHHFTLDIALLAPPPPEAQRLFADVAANQESMDAF